MRTIDISTDVYAAIWAARKPGEESEDAILARVLRAQSTPQPRAIEPTKIGFSDSRFDIQLPEGFEIFRNYKGTEFRARAIAGQWKLSSTGKLYPSLNQLSRATSGNIENAWRNWYFTGLDGKRHLIEGLRNDIKANVRHLVG